MIHQEIILLIDQTLVVQVDDIFLDGLIHFQKFQSVQRFPLKPSQLFIQEIHSPTMEMMAMTERVHLPSVRMK